MKFSKEYEIELVDTLHETARDKRLFHAFLTDLLTPHELGDLAVRWQIVKQLYKRIPQRRISRNLKVGVATVTRGSRELLDKDGGFNQILKKYYAIHK